jgi:nucleoside-diphosphate-sugar epimerase
MDDLDRPQTVVITGASSYFGRVLLPLLETQPQIGRVIGIDRAPLSSEIASTCSKLAFHRMDVRDPNLEGLIEGADILVHLAFVLMRLPGDREVDDINLRGTRQVCESAARQGVRKLIITSSVVAYGMHPDNPIPLTETSQLRPNPGLYYSRAKASNEKYLDEFEKRHPEMILTRLRPCTVIGPQAPREQMASLTGEPAILVTGANPAIQLVHEEDVASALLLAIQKDLPGIYNLTSDDPCTLEELVKTRGGKSLALPFILVKGLMALAWRLRRSVFAPEWADLSRYSLVASNERLKSAGWQPKYTTRTALADLLSSNSRERSHS